MGVHAGLQRARHILVEDVCGHGDDRDGFRIRSVERADGGGGGETVHDRHTNVHENDIVPALRTGCEHVDSLLSVARMLGKHVLKLQQVCEDLGVLLDILCHEDALSGEGSRERGFVSRGYGNRRYRVCGSAAAVEHGPHFPLQNLGEQRLCQNAVRPAL